MYLSKFQQLKIYIETFTGLERDALHIYAGLMVFFIVALLHGRQLKSIYALLAVLVIAIGAELLDARDDLINYDHWRFGPSLHDIINTSFWPTIIYLSAKFKFWKK